MTILQSLERSSEVEGLKGEAMRELGERQINATARNYLLTASRKASGGCLVSGERKWCWWDLLTLHWLWVNKGVMMVISVPDVSTWKPYW